MHTFSYYYRIMLVLLLFMHLLVVDYIIVFLLCTMLRREHITPVLTNLHWLKIQDRSIYKILMLTYESYYNMAPPYLCELINKKESHVNTRLGTDHHQLIMLPINKDCYIVH